MSNFKPYVPSSARLQPGDLVEFNSWYRNETSPSPEPGPKQVGQVWDQGPKNFTVWVVLPDQRCVKVATRDCTLLGDAEGQMLLAVELA